MRQDVLEKLAAPFDMCAPRCRPTSPSDFLIAPPPIHPLSPPPPPPLSLADTHTHTHTHTLYACVPHHRYVNDAFALRRTHRLQA